jgi:hypothetical protein
VSATGNDQPKESLILRERCQSELFLFDVEPPPVINREKPKFNCDGERLFRDRPDVYKAVVRALAIPGVSSRLICQTYHLAADTLRAVREREAITIDEQKKILLKNFAHGTLVATERVIEELPTASAKDAILAAGVFCDKMQVLSGDATARISFERDRPPFNNFEGFEQFVRELEAREIEARVIEADDTPVASLTNGETP